MIGNVYLFGRRGVVVVAEGPHPPRLGPPRELEVYTLAALRDGGGVAWPLARLETALFKRERLGRLVTP